MKTPWTSGSMRITPTLGGYNIKSQNSGVVAFALQRNPHPLYGMGITDAEAMANAQLFAIANEMANAVIEWASCAFTQSKEYDDAESKLYDLSHRLRAIGEQI